MNAAEISANFDSSRRLTYPPMAGIKDLLSLFYWINNQKEPFMDASIGTEKPGNHQSDSDLSTQTQKSLDPKKPSGSKSKNRK